jgi:hypothetical protein
VPRAKNAIDARSPHNQNANAPLSHFFLLATGNLQLRESRMSESNVIANQKRILANQKAILSNQTTIQANQATIKKNQAAILKNQGTLNTIVANQKKILSKLK